MKRPLFVLVHAWSTKNYLELFIALTSTPRVTLLENADDTILLVSGAAKRDLLFINLLASNAARSGHAAVRIKPASLGRDILRTT